MEVTVLYALGLLLVFAGERLLESGAPRGVATGLGLLLVLVSVLLRLSRIIKAVAERRTVERSVLGLQALGLLGLAIYFIQQRHFGISSTLTTALAVLYPVAFLCALVPTLLAELAYFSMAKAPHVELGRIRDAILTGLGLAAVLVFAWAAYYVADERDGKVDLSYYRAARPGQATRNIARALTEPLTVSTFFPPHNEVGSSVLEYLKELAHDAPKVKLESLDPLVDVAAARELGVTNGGVVVIHRGKKREQLVLPLDFDRARTDLQGLDRNFQRPLLAVSRSNRVVYFTAGHGERAEAQVGTVDQRSPLHHFREFLKGQNEELKDLGAAEGLATEVPGDAAAVFVIGPTRNFLPEEMAALKRYEDKGGRLFVALDPEAGLPFKELVAPLGVTFTPTSLCNDQVFIPRLHQPSDRVNLAVSSFSSHPAVTTLAQYSHRMGIIFLGAGYLEAQPKPPPGLSVDLSVHAHSATWNDGNGNFEFDAPAETRKDYALMAAVTLRKDKHEGRAVVVADSDALSDLVLENPGNTYLAEDTVKWLLGDEASAGAMDVEVDAPIRHTRKQDVAWFYGTIFLVPALVLATGAAVTRRQRRRA